MGKVKLGEPMICEDCGKECIRRGAQQKRCPECAKAADSVQARTWRKEAREDPENHKKAGVRFLPEDPEWKKNNMSFCAKCAFKGSLAGQIHCNYLDYQEQYSLPRRQWPRPRPQECLWRSSVQSRAGFMKPETARELLAQRARPVMNTMTGKLYKSAKEAAEASKTDLRVIYSLCRTEWHSMKEMPLWRYLTAEEMNLLREIEKRPAP